MAYESFKEVTTTISYLPFRLLLVKHGMNKETLVREKVFSRATAAKLGKDAHVSLEVVDRICARFEVPVEDVIEWKKDGAPK